MSPEGDDLFAERSLRPRVRTPAEPSLAAPPPGGASAGEARQGAGEPAHDAAALLRDLRGSVRATVDEWLTERSNTIGLAVTQVVEDVLMRLQAVHAARLREVVASYEQRLAALEQERDTAVRAGARRRRARARSVELELREKIERLERALTEASLEAVERLRDVERRETERRLEVERRAQEALREKDEELARLRRGGSGPDSMYDALADQLRSRRPGSGEH